MSREHIKYYRRRAVELRVRARIATLPYFRDEFRQLAQNFDRMAEGLETEAPRIVEKEKPGGKPPD